MFFREELISPSPNKAIFHCLHRKIRRYFLAQKSKLHGVKFVEGFLRIHCEYSALCYESVILGYLSLPAYAQPKERVQLKKGMYKDSHLLQIDIEKLKMSNFRNNWQITPSDHNLKQMNTCTILP